MENKRKDKNKKAISLIVLVITIIVIIILSTTVIVTLVQKNPISNAKEAVNANDIKVAQESFIMWMSKRWIENSDEAGGMYSGEVTNDASTLKFIKEDTKTASASRKVYLASDQTTKEISVTLSDLGVDGLDKVVINQNVVTSVTKGNVSIDKEETEYPKIDVGTIVTNSNSTITGKYPTYQNPVIPVGFKAIDTEKAKWIDNDNDGVIDEWNNGLVIQDGYENEYVWIPVDGTNVKYKKWNGSNNANYTVKFEQTEDDENLPKGIKAESDQIEKYQGFFVARYEAGLPDEQTTEELMKTRTSSKDENNRTDIGNPQSKKNKIVWVRIDYNHAKENSENVISTKYVQSGLITGTQWDTVLRFIATDNINLESRAWGNYYDTKNFTITGYYRTKYASVVYSNGKYTKSSGGYLLLETGKFSEAVKAGSPKNLCDIAGNAREWTTETVKIRNDTNRADVKIGNKITRGGTNTDNMSSTVREAYCSNSYSDEEQTFRFVLYIK